MIELLESRIAPAAVYALDRSNHLLMFDSHDPGTILSLKAINGLPSGEQLLTLGGIYGADMCALGASGNIYWIQTNGSAVYQGRAPALVGDHFGLAMGSGVFSVESDAGSEATFARGTVATAPFGTLQYAANDRMNAGRSPIPVAAAYDWNSGSSNPPPLYLIDAATDSLVLDQAGTLTTVGPLGVDVDDGNAGLCVDEPFGLAVLTVGGVPKVYSLDKLTGAASLLGTIGDGQTPIAGAWSPQTYTWTGAAGDHLWSTGRNWSLGATPGDGAILKFPASAAGPVINDLPGLAVAEVDMTGAYSLSGNPLTVNGSFDAISTAVDLDLRTDGSVAIHAQALNGELQLNGHLANLYVSHLNGAVRSASPGGTMRVMDWTTVVSGTIDGGIGVEVYSGAEFQLDGAQLGAAVSIPETSPRYLTEITGHGSLGSLTLNAGRLSPGIFDLTGGDSWIGMMTINGDLKLSGSGYLLMDLHSMAAGKYDQVVVTGMVDLGEWTPALRSMPDLPVGATFKLIDNQGSLPIASGGDVDGQIITSGNQDFRVSLTGGDGNDLVVTRLAPPEVTISGGGEAVGAAGGSLHYEVQLSHPTATPQTIHVTSRGGTAVGGTASSADYQAIDRDITIPPGFTSMSFSVSVNRNTVAGPDRDYYVGITSATFAEIDPAEVRSVIHYDGPLPEIRSGGAFVELNGKTARMLEIRLDHPYPREVSFNYATEDGTAHDGRDYRGAHGSITIPAGEKSVNVPIKILGDTTPDRDQREFTLRLSNVVNATSAGSYGYAIFDDDHAPIYTMRFEDADGDTIVLHDTLGRLNYGVMRNTAVRGAHGLDFNQETWGKRFEGDQITVTGIRHGNGDGLVNMDYVLAFGVNLRSLAVDGPLGSLIVGSVGSKKTALQTLEVNGFGLNARTDSFILGNVGRIIDHDNFRAELHILGSIEALRIQGGLIGDAAAYSGTVQIDGNLGSAVFGGDIRGGVGERSGAISVQGDIGSIRAHGLDGGAGEYSGVISTRGRIGAISLAHGIWGGSGLRSGLLEANSAGTVLVGHITGGLGEGGGGLIIKRDLGSLSVLGDVRLGTADYAGSVGVGGDLRKMKVGGGITLQGASRGGIFVNGNLGTLIVSGDVTGSDSRQVSILARGSGDGDTIGRLSIGGAVAHVDIAAGYDWNGHPVNPAAQIGAIVVGKTWASSNLVAGALPGDDKLFGTSDDVPIAGSEESVSRIASIQIGGAILAGASGDSTRRFGIVAREIGRLTVQGKPQALTDQPDDLALDPDGGFHLRELP